MVFVMKFNKNQIKIAIAGTHGSGKSTLIRNMIDEFEKYGVSIYHVDESARKYPYELGSTKAQRWIWEAHINEELKGHKSESEIIICDRTLLDNLIYYRNILNNKKIDIDPIFAALWDSTIQWMNTYDYISVLNLNWDFIRNDLNDKLRIKDENQTIRINELFTKYLKPYQNIDINRFNYRSKIEMIINDYNNK